MKAKIKVGFSVKVQAATFNPIESIDGLEIEFEAKDEEELLEKYDHYQKIIQERSIDNAMEGAKDFISQRAKLLLEMDGDE